MAALVEELSKHQRELLPHTGPYLGPTNLDIGCGTGLTSVIHQRELGVAPTLCDVADIRDPLARSLPFALIIGGKLPFPDQAFASAYLQYVLHHLPPAQPVEELLRESRRVARRVIIVEEIISERTHLARAKEFDREMNEHIHPGTAMPVYRYYSAAEIGQFLEQLNCELRFHTLVSTGSPENGFLETHVFVAE